MVASGLVIINRILKMKKIAIALCLAFGTVVGLNAQQAKNYFINMKRKQKKLFKRNKKEYTRLSDHIGFLPLVMVSPADSELILGGSDERRRFMDVVISQYDKEYLNALIRYNKALQQRNTLLKSDLKVDEELFLVWEEMMAQAGSVVFQKREAFIEEFIPIFQSFYSYISQDKEIVSLSYDSHVFPTRI